MIGVTHAVNQYTLNQYNLLTLARTSCSLEATMGAKMGRSAAQKQPRDIPSVMLG